VTLGGHLLVGWLWRGTLDTFGATWRAILLAIALALASLGVQWGHNGWDAMKADFWQTLWQTAMPIGIVGFGILLWNLWLAPAALAFETAQRAIAALAQSAPPPAAPREPEPLINHMALRNQAKWTTLDLAKILAVKDESGQNFVSAAMAWQQTIISAMKDNKIKYICVQLGHEYGKWYSPSVNTEMKQADAIAWAEAIGFDMGDLK
jgi:hypothetical protein